MALQGVTCEKRPEGSESRASGRAFQLQAQNCKGPEARAHLCVPKTAVAGRRAGRKNPVVEDHTGIVKALPFTLEGSGRH